MWAFFRGWRRKVGCFALLLASTISVLWVRSDRIASEFRVTVAGREHVVASVLGRFFWRSSDKSKTTNHYNYWMESDVDEAGLTAESLPELLAIPPELLHLNTRQWFIPYWPVTTTLIVLSAYLILWKPRTAKPNGQCRA